jgi:hypothetical protein
VRIAVIGIVALLGGCHLWYKPVPIESAVGRERIFIAGDSFSVHRDPRFEIYGIGSQAVFDAYEQLNRTYRTFDRYFGAPAPRLAVVLSTSGMKADQELDSVLRGRGLTPLRYARPRNSVLMERLGEPGYEGSLWPVAPFAARVLLASLAGPSATASARVDTSAIAVFPAWFRAAVMHVVGDASSLPLDIAYVQESRGTRITVERLMGWVRATAADSALDSYRRVGANENDRLFASQSSAFAQFLLDREGQDILARLARGYAARRTFESMAAELRTGPTVAEMDERWSAWLSAQRPAH